MTSEWRSGRGVSERDGRSDQPGNGGAQSARVAKMTAVDVLGRVDELADGTGGSVDAVTGTAIAPFRKSRLRKSKER
jgi:hypothetical protein